MDDFVASSSRWRSALLVLMALGGVVLGLWVAGVFGNQLAADGLAKVYGIVIGWIFSVLCALAGATLAERLVDDRELLRVSQSGLKWEPWSD